MEYEAIILAAGESSRSALNYHKIFYPIENQPMIFWSMKPFLEDSECKKIILVIHFNDQNRMQALIHDDKIHFVIGGKTRQESVYNGLKQVQTDYVFVHDGARPFLKKELLSRLKEELKVHSCVIPVLPVIDCLKIVQNQRVIQTVSRENYRMTQTPQAFLTSQLKKAHQLANHQQYLDDSAMIEDLLHEEVYCIEGDLQNKKMTNPEDFR